MHDEHDSNVLEQWRGDWLTRRLRVASDGGIVWEFRTRRDDQWTAYPIPIAHPTYPDMPYFGESTHAP